MSEVNLSPIPPWTLKRRFGYFKSWLRADLVGMTVCKVLGHKESDEEFKAFCARLDEIWPPHPDAISPVDICARCGGMLR